MEIQKATRTKNFEQQKEKRNSKKTDRKYRKIEQQKNQNVDKQFEVDKNRAK